MIQPCEYLELPPDETPVWRFLSLPKFLALLDARSLHFARLDLLEDVHEGTIPGISLDCDSMLRVTVHEEGRSRLHTCEMRPILRDAKDRRSSTWVSCWFAARHDNDAMWKLYGGQDPDFAVAIRSTVGRLKSVLTPCTDHVYIGLVSYDKTELPLHVVECYFRKRPCFTHEQELRVLISNSLGPVRGNRPVIPIPVDLATLIEAVIVSPRSEHWYSLMLRSLLDKLGCCDVEMTGSTMSLQPGY